jgi:hypothetical protein
MQKIRKINMREEKQRGTQEDKLNHNRVRVFKKGSNGYKPEKIV